MCPNWPRRAYFDAVMRLTCLCHVHLYLTKWHSRVGSGTCFAICASLEKGVHFKTCARTHTRVSFCIQNVRPHGHPKRTKMSPSDTDRMPKTPQGSKNRGPTLANRAFQGVQIKHTFSCLFKSVRLHELKTWERGKGGIRSTPRPSSNAGRGGP